MDTHEQDNIIGDIKYRLMKMKESMLSQFDEIEAMLETLCCGTNGNQVAADPLRLSIIANGKTCDPEDLDG